MARKQLSLPRDQRTTVAAMAAVIVIAAILVFLMMALVKNVSAY